jgi:uncharacterized protein YecE (DUF72 family)
VQLRHGSYGAARLCGWADQLAPLLEQGRDVYAYFNNDWYGHAVIDAVFLRDQLTRSGLQAQSSG